MSVIIQRPAIPNPLSIPRGGTGAQTAPAARDALGLGDLATLDAPGNTTEFLRADATWAVPAGGGGGLTVEEVQDTVAAMFPTSSSLDFTYNDPAGTIAAEVRFNGVTENHLSFSDTTADNASTGQHGLLPKLSGVPTQYLDGSGAWTTPPGGTNYWSRSTLAYTTLTTGLLAFWRLEEASGNRVDSVGGLALVPQGTPGNAAGKTGQAVALNGTNQYLTMADNATMSTGTTVSFTLGCWVYFTSLPSNEVALLGKGNGSLANATEYCLLRHHPNNRFAILVSSGSVEQRLEYTALTPSINTWYFVVAWYDHVNDILGMSVNDGTPATMSYSAGLFDSAQPFEVGRFPSYAGEYLPGRVDNILFYKRVLTATEITAWYNSGTGQDYPPTADTPVGMLTPQAASDMLVLGSSPETPSGMANGALRWSGTDFEGRKGGAWVSLVGGTMATQNADAVAITGGAISLGGHAPTGVLDVQGSVVASDAANSYFGARLWPVAPSGATEVNGLRVESVTGAASATATHKGVVVRDMPVTSGQVMGMDSRISAGANRYNIYAIGTAANYFAGTVGIQATPASDSALFLQWARATQHGIHLRPTDSDSGGNPAIRFVNMAYGVVGSITTNATATAYNTSSDHRLKRSIQALLGGVEAMQRMRPVSFVWQSTDEPDIGFLAHELMTVAPNAVQGLPDEVNLDGSIKPQQVDQSKLIPILVAAIKELVARVEVLEQALGV